MLIRKGRGAINANYLTFQGWRDDLDLDDNVQMSTHQNMKIGLFYQFS